MVPYPLVAARVQLVTRAHRVSIEPEYIVADLKSHEFDIIEPPI